MPHRHDALATRGLDLPRRRRAQAGLGKRCVRIQLPRNKKQWQSICLCQLAEDTASASRSTPTIPTTTREKKFIEAVNRMQYKRMILTPDDCREVVECANEFFRGSDYQYPAGGGSSASQKMLYQPPLEIAGFEYRARWDDVVRTGIDTASGVVPPLKLGVRDNHYTAPIRESRCPDCGTCIFMTRRGDIGPLYVPPFLKSSFQIVECPCSSQTVPSAAAGVRDTSPGCVEWTPASATEPMCAVGPQNALYEPACASQPTQGGMVGTFWDDGF